MSAQTNYNYSTPKGVPGGKFDIAFDEVVSRNNDNEDGVMKYGIAVVKGTTAGKTVKVPVAASVAGDFEGVALALPNTEQDMAGNVVVKKNRSLSVMKKGNVWGRLSEYSEAVTPGATAYVIVSGEEPGFFTTRSAKYEYYVKCKSTDAGALEVVASGASTGQINLADATPAKGFTPAVGDYVLKVEGHAATVDIGAKFGAESGDGIAVIVL